MRRFSHSKRPFTPLPPQLGLPRARPMPRPARYTIRAACALTGINPNTLRAWERRHGLVRPERTPSGYRLYTEHDLSRLRHIQELLDSGMSIGEVTLRLYPNMGHEVNGDEIEFIRDMMQGVGRNS